MGKRKKRKKDDSLLEETSRELTLSPSGVPPRRLEALAIAMFIAAIALCIALFSFDPADPGRRNLVGPLGAQIAELILGGVGVVGYVAGLLCVAAAALTLMGRLRFPSALNVGAALALTAGATVLAELLTEPQLLGHPAGGVFGVVLCTLLISIAGKAGAALFGVGAILIGVLGVSDLSFSLAARDAWAFVKRSAHRVIGQGKIWIYASRAARTRETELLEAARSQRALATIERGARERTLKEDLEEKARIAVLKATAKAEQRALAKIAAQEAKERIEQEQAEKDVEVEELEFEEAASSAPSAVGEETDDEASDAEYELDIPGPGAEPEIVIGNLDEIDDDGFTAEDADEYEDVEEDEEAEEDEADSEAEDAYDEEEYEYSDYPDEAEPMEPAADVIDEIVRTTQLPQKALPAPKAAAKEAALEDDALEIHERIETPTEFDDDAIAVEEPELRKEFELPPLHLLDYEGDAPEVVDQEVLRAKAMRLEAKLGTYGVDGKVTAIRPGPVVTTYEYQPAPGVKVAKIANLSDDIAMSMEALRVRIVAPIPGRGVVGIELPNDARENVYLKEVIAHDRFRKQKSLLTLALGKDAEGVPQVRDLRKMPHLMIAGTTGSGKSVSINTIICSILYKATPDQVKFIMVDPKMLELSLYEDVPHLLLPVVTDPRKASLALQWTVDEMERRYQLLSDMKVRDLDSFNKRLEKLADRRADEAEAAKLGLEYEESVEADGHGRKKRLVDPWKGQDLPEKMPYIVVLIDEFADLMCVAPRDVEASVQRLAQKARAAGIHVLLATQRPSTDVITGVIKNNFPSRISFRVASRHDSATILNNPGAENLLGMGDSLMLDASSPMPQRIHGGFVSETEVERVVDFWKAQAKPVYDPNILKKREEEAAEFDEEDVDEHYERAVGIVIETRKASISGLQRRLRVGYNRAARMVEMMEAQGIVGPAVGPKGEREILVKKE